jgi:hypothetical protein
VRKAALWLFILAVILALFRNYYTGNGVLFGDSNLQWDPLLLSAALGQLAHSWAPALGGGRPAIIINATTALPTLLQAAVSPFGIALSTVLVYPVVLFAAYAGAWMAARKITGRDLSAHIVAAFYAGNPWIWDRVLLGHLGILAAAAAAAWLLAILAYRGELRAAFVPLLFAACGVLLFCDARISYMVFLGLAVLGVFWIVRGTRAGTPGVLTGIAALVAPVAGFLLNAWWTLPYVQMPGINPVRKWYPPLEDVVSNSRFSDFFHNLVFSGSFLHFSWERAAALGRPAFAVWYAAMVTVVIAALLGRFRSRFWTIFLRLAAVAAILLSFGTVLFTPGFAMWVYSTVPMASFFRDPNKIAFAALLCVVLLLAAKLRGATRGMTWLVAAAVAIAVLPAFSGNLQGAQESGLQIFSERPNFVGVLHFIRDREHSNDYRVGLLPPWTAEVALSAGEHPVAEPFVFQYALPTMDAKLITVASDMNMSAWRVFEDFYYGHDAHPAASLARLGIKYLVWDDAAALSAGGANTPFFNTSPAIVKYALDRAGFRELFRSGTLHVYENPAFEPLLRTMRTPAVIGSVAERLRALLPEAAIGDGIEPFSGPPADWPFAAFPVGGDLRAACLANVPRAKVLLAADAAGPHSDWTSHWVDSDYLQQGTGDRVLGRMLANFPLPYAFTESHAVIGFAVDVPRGGRISIDGGTLASHASVEYAVDGRGWRALRLPAMLPDWVTIPDVAPGLHNVQIRGSLSGVVLRAVTGEMPARCQRAYLALHALPAVASGSKNWLLPAPVTTIDLRESGGRFFYDAPQVRARGLLPGPGADAILFDHDVTTVGLSFGALRGYHLVEFFAQGDRVAASRWTQQFNAVPTGLRATVPFLFGPAYSEEGASATISGLVPGSVVLLRIPFTGDPQDAELRIFENGLLLAREPLALAQRTIAIPAYSEKIDVAVERENGPRSALALQSPQAFSGVLLSSTVLDLPDIAAPVAAGTRIALSQAIRAAQPLHFAVDDRSLVPPHSVYPNVRAKGSQAVVQVRGLNSTLATRCTLMIAYDTAGGPASRAVGDVDVSRAAANTSFAFAVEPRAFDLLPRFECDKNEALLGIASARVSFTDGEPGGLLVSAPAVFTTPGRAVEIAHRFRSPEELTVNGSPPDVVSVSSFDPAWTFGNNEHVIVNGSQNGWIDRGGHEIGYTVQRVYLIDAAIALVFWVLTLAAIAAALVLRKNYSARSADSYSAS